MNSYRYQSLLCCGGWMLALSLLTITTQQLAAAQSLPQKPSNDQAGMPKVSGVQAAGDPPAGKPHVHTIAVSNEAPFYSPTSVSIDLGDTVQWVTSERTDVHSVRAQDGAFTSPDLGANSTWSFRFRREGEYAYACRFHPWMRGKILVRTRTVNATELTLNSGQHWRSAVLIDKPGDDYPWLITLGRIDLLRRLALEKTAESHYLPQPAHLATSFAFDPSGHLWFTQPASGKLFEFDLERHTTAAIFGHQSSIRVSALAVDNNDGSIWFFDAASRGFAVLEPKTHKLSLQKPVRLKSEPVSMLVSQDRKIWFIEARRNCVGWYDPGVQEVKEYFLPQDASVLDFKETASTLWLTDVARNKVMSIRAGWVFEYTLPSSFAKPQGLALDKHGNVWVAETAANKIAVLRLNQQFEEYALPKHTGAPACVAIDPRGTLWFTQQAVGKIGTVAAVQIDALGAFADRNESISSLKHH